MADENTALLIDGAIGKVSGTGAVYFAMPPHVSIQPGNKLSVGPSNVLRLLNGAGQFDLAAWNFAPQDTNAVSYPVSVTNGEIIPTFPYGPNY